MNFYLYIWFSNLYNCKIYWRC